MSDAYGIEKAPGFTPEVIISPPLIEFDAEFENPIDMGKMIDFIENGSNGVDTLLEICREANIAEDPVRGLINDANKLYEATFFEDPRTKTNLDIDKLMILYDDTEEYTHCSLLHTLENLRDEVQHKDAVAHADRLARLLILDQNNSITIPRTGKQSGSELSVVTPPEDE